MFFYRAVSVPNPDIQPHNSDTKSFSLALLLSRRASGIIYGFGILIHVMPE